MGGGAGDEYSRSSHGAENLPRRQHCPPHIAASQSSRNVRVNAGAQVEAAG